MAVYIDSSLVSLIGDCENRLEICKLELDPDPRLQTLCFLELPTLASDASQFFIEAYKEWVPTSKTYVRTRSSRGYHLPFYSFEISTMALLFRYQRQGGPGDKYALIISVGALISVIPTDACNIPWEDWGPSSTHFFESTALLISVGPFWIMGFSSEPLPVLLQYDLQRTRHTRLMPGDTPLSQPRPPVVNSAKMFQYDIETRLPYRDVMFENGHLTYSGYIVADREWVVGVTSLVRGFLST